MSAPFNAHSRFRPSMLVLALALSACDELGESSEAPDEAALGNDTSQDFELGDYGPEVAAAHAYLRRFGYFPNPELAAHYPGWTPVIDTEPEDPELFDLALEDAITHYQQANGLPSTGRLDATTRALMQQPRCGFPDHYSLRPTTGALAQFAADQGNDSSARHTHTPGDQLAHPLDPSEYKLSSYSWPYTELKYGFTSFSGDVSPSFQRQAVVAAMNTWSAVAPIAWAERAWPDVRIAFVPRAHGDTQDFSASTYAHGVLPICSASVGAFTCEPLAGDVHFNDESYTWGSGNNSTVQDIQSIALHELGHALGLDHSADSNAVMAAGFPPGVVRRVLTQDDINGIKALYPTFRDLRIYEPNWYLHLNPDLVMSFGWDPIMGSIHWLKYGRYEARRGSPAFDAGYYLQTNGDVAQAFGANNFAAAFWHWRETGLTEGRRSSPAFDSQYYLNRYPELPDAFGAKNYGAALTHWIHHGIAEGRRASSSFDPVYYLQANPDVVQAYGAKNYQMALVHWLTVGLKQNRKGAP